MKDRAAGADLIFMPYNYLVDEKIRENFEINYENAILIFDEAHNMTSTLEDQASFVVETNNLEVVGRELAELQDAKKQNEDKELKSTDEDIQHLKMLTSSFKQYLENYDLYSRTNDRFQIQNNFLSKSSCVLPGSKIFEIMFYGTKFSDIDFKSGEEKTFTLKENFLSDISSSFNDVLSDIVTLKNDQGAKTKLEEWYDVLKRVMRLYNNGEIKKSIDGDQGTGADDFYIYIHDEEDTGTYQQKFKKGKRTFNTKSMARDTNRKIGFWCFNAGIGMKSIANLKPRSILLTSGTLSPMDSF